MTETQQIQLIAILGEAVSLIDDLYEGAYFASDPLSVRKAEVQRKLAAGAELLKEEVLSA